MDESYHTYLNRVAKMTLPATYESQVKNIQESPKFRVTTGGDREPVAFPGYSVITPPGAEDARNAGLYQELASCQQQLISQLEPDLLVLVEPTSFHFTLADLIWDSAYQNAIAANVDFESKLIERIEDSFYLYQQSLAQPFGTNIETAPLPIRWQIMGLTIRPRAIEVSLVPKDESSYERIIAFRRAIYQNSNLISLGIEQQYYFTAHVTLAYFANVDREIDNDRLCKTLQNYNDRWLDRPQELVVEQGQLRKFENMSTYKRQPNYPLVQL